MTDNTPDYNNNLAFAPGDWSDSRVVGNTDRTASTIQLIEKIEELEKDNIQFRQLLKECQHMIIAYSINNNTFTKDEVKDIITKIDEVLK